MKIHIPAFEPMAKCNEHLRHGAFDIDLGDDIIQVVHAEWIDIRFDSMWKSMLATCSHCKVRGEVRVRSNECGFAVPDSDYCPHCGAKMDGGINK